MLVYSLWSCRASDSSHLTSPADCDWTDWCQTADQLEASLKNCDWLTDWLTDWVSEWVSDRATTRTMSHELLISPLNSNRISNYLQSIQFLNIHFHLVKVKLASGSVLPILAISFTKHTAMNILNIFYK